MMDRRKHRVSLWTAVLVLVLSMTPDSLPILATEVPVQQPPQIVNVVVNASAESGDVVVRWSGGTPPFIVVRGESPEFANETTVRYLASDVPSPDFADRAALRDDRRYWYQVYDGNAKPEIFTIDRAKATEGEILIIKGVGFKGSCSDIRFMLEGGQRATVMTCSFTELTVRLPKHAISGTVLIVTRNGIGGFGDNQGGWGDYPIRHPVTW